ncbi:alpha/beta-hydrolase [Microthyrium microscopicum]|uniref:Carboxylic ester hydrolase n=1 Tax=Microthyrium microscopicum TaxID=703497 RepID=A0A6A6UU91_9PEZI|nr:alpha/beta-hydrolase [Microthyrium microscopicum]
MSPACYVYYAFIGGAVAAAGCSSGSTSIPAKASISGLPVVDLGYGLWQGTINETGGYYNFSNVRYAQPPVGQLRFAAPKPPRTNRSVIHDGQHGRVCPQGYPAWTKERNMFVDAYLADPKNISSFTKKPAPGIDPTATPPPQDNGWATEDCLFLDVISPVNVYDSGSLNNSGGAPVHVWLFGGGFYSGDKNDNNPSGFVVESMKNPQTQPGVIWVAINYRIGALGWLAGSNFTASGGIPNAGLHDQRLALHWIQRNIHLFGGDPNKITLMGASAGASSTLHQITAYGGSKGNAPFQKAVPESPAFAPSPSDAFQNSIYQRFLASANLTSLADLRKLSSEDAIKLNSLTIFNALYGNDGGLGPAVDGTFVPNLLTILLKQGNFSKNVQGVFAGHNTDEGLIFTDPSIQNTTAFNAFIRQVLLAGTTNQTYEYIENTLYPAVFNNLTGLGYNDTTSRLATLIADYTLNCNVRAVLEAFNVNKTHGYLFTEGAALHSEETPYMFYSASPTVDEWKIGVVNGTVAQTLQNWILNFGATGNPNGEGSPSIPTYGPDFTMGVLSQKGVGNPVKDPAGKERCEFWQSGAYAKQ